MRCREVNELLVAYLDGEVTPSEWQMVEAHLAGCDTCRKEMNRLAVMQRRLGRSLQAVAADAAPSPQAWSRLQARLAKEARPSPSWLPTWLQRLAPGVGRINQIFEGGVTMKKGFAFATLVVLVIALGTVAFVPSVRAQVGEILNTWFRFQILGGRFEIGMAAPDVDFIPLRPTYLPADVTYSLGGAVKGKTGALRQAYGGEDWFVDIIQTRALTDKPLPVGREVAVNGQPGMLVNGLKGTFEFIPRLSKEAIKEKGVIGTPPATLVHFRLEGISIPYDDGKRLVWYAGDVKVEMLSNLPVAEMLKIAESLVPAEAGEGKPPFQPPLDLPSGSEGEPFIIQEGPIEYSP